MNYCITIHRHTIKDYWIIVVTEFFYQAVEDIDLALTPTDHLSPPSTTSRLSDSDPSDLDDARERRVADGASISSVGSSTR